VAVVLAGRLPTNAVVHAVTLPAVLLLVVCGALICYAVLERPLQVSARRLLRPRARPGLESPDVAVAERPARS
jgi:hypothetical protein